MSLAQAFLQAKLAHPMAARSRCSLNLRSLRLQHRETSEPHVRQHPKQQQSSRNRAALVLFRVGVATPGDDLAPSTCCTGFGRRHWEVRDICTMRPGKSLVPLYTRMMVT